MGKALFSNNATATLAATANPAATTLTLASGKGALFPNPTGGDYFYATLVNAANAIEIVKCTARVADAIGVVRAQEGTTALSYNIGDKIELRATAQGLSDCRDSPVTTARIDDLAVTNAKLADSSVGPSKLADGAATTAKIPDGAITAPKLAAGAALASLGYTPVQQGGGAGQGSNKLYLGWTGSRVTLQVDASLINMMTEDGTARSNSGGYRGLPQTVISGTASFGLAQLGGHLFHFDVSACTLTVPAHATFGTAPENGSAVTIANHGGAGAITITPAGGVAILWAGTALSGARTLAAQGLATLMQIDTDVWMISGAGLS